MMHSVSKAVHDRVSTNSTGNKSISYCLNESVSCIALNKDSSQVCVAGRNVFQVLSIYDDEFKENLNLRVGRRNLNYCTLDIAWNRVHNNILASAATNGHVVVWDLNRPSKTKLDHVFNENHKRTVNRVSFHDSEDCLLLSGSQDGLIKLFDIRKQTETGTFNGRSESCRDVQFCPSNLGYFTFAAAFENGNVQIWDMRKPDRFEKQFTAHNGPVFTIDWHPDDKNLFGSGGRDKAIKVWDLSRMNPTHTVHTIASVARIKWRPERRNHIASCSLLVDFNINVWDIRRPYIPFASFSEHKDVPTGIVWKGDKHVFLSSGKDCMVFQHIFKDAKRPADDVIPAGLGVSNTGHVSFAFMDKVDGSGRSGGAKLTSFFRKNPDRSEQFTKTSSTLFVVDSLDDSDLSMRWFVASAIAYKIRGSSLDDLLEHNAKVAECQGRTQVAMSWRSLKMLYCCHTSNFPGGHHSRNASSGKFTVEKLESDQTGKLKDTLADGERIEKHIEGKEKNTEHKAGTGGSDDESDLENLEKEQNLANIAIGLANNAGDYFFGDGDTNTAGFDLDNLSAMDDKDGWSLPREAFQPRHEIADRPIPPEQLVNGHESPLSANDSDLNSSLPQSAFNDPILSTDLNCLQFPAWKFNDIVINMMKSYVENGDVQTPVTMIVVLGDRIRPHLDEQLMENWFLSYIDLLSRFKLWNISNEIIKLSKLSQVSMLNQRSTSIHSNCGKCNRPLPRVGWLCDKCKVITSLCSICHLPVKGMFLWCQGCSHGGHLNHMLEWLQVNPSCPSGCGHRCEYN